MKGWSKTVILAALAAALPANGKAQERVRVEGRVLEAESELPVPNAEVLVRTATDRFLRHVVADDSGRFVLNLRNVAAIRIHASRLGYRDNATPVLHFDDHTYFEVEIRLDREAVLLAPLEVVARRTGDRSPILTAFDRRSRNGLGYYFTRRQIEAIDPVYVSDLLARVPGVRLHSSGSGGRRTVSMSRSEARRCPVQVFVDGILVTQRLPRSGGAVIEGLVVDDVVTPNSVEGIEIYRGLSTVPPEFLTPEADCGVIAIWTRRGN